MYVSMLLITPSSLIYFRQFKISELFQVKRYRIILYLHLYIWDNLSASRSYFLVFYTSNDYRRYWFVIYFHNIYLSSLLIMHNNIRYIIINFDISSNTNINSNFNILIWYNFLLQVFMKFLFDFIPFLLYKKRRRPLILQKSLFILNLNYFFALINWNNSYLRV